MRRLSFFDKIVFAINILFAILLFLACLSPYLSVRTFSPLPFLGLSVPVLVLINLVFFGYWSLKRKRLLLFSFLPLFIGYFTLGTFIRFGDENAKIAKDDLTILSYNVRGFNKEKNISSETIFEDIRIFIEEQNPDILCLQESGNTYKMRDYNYPHKYVVNNGGKIKTILNIFSKYPILNAELIYFPKTKNNACYADILIKNDTIRVYNLHMQSLGITPGSGIIKRSSPRALYKRMTAKFEKQETQAMLIAESGKSVSYKKIIAGDFNNNQFSRTYNVIKSDNLDSFDQQGSGYGRTFKFHGIPARIDFILADPEFEVISYKNFDQKYSDHYPIMASFRLKEN